MIKVNKKGKCKTSLSLAKYNEIVTILKGATAKTGYKTNDKYNLLKRFDIYVRFHSKWYLQIALLSSVNFQKSINGGLPSCVLCIWKFDRNLIVEPI